ncbi:aldehyde dehydrogenase family protein [Cellulomonas hominis]|nr:aldehyde dehydrogenase family protein [Cellulomonas hominis]
MTLTLVGPADGAALGTVPETTPEEVAAHARDAQAVFDSGVWSGLPPRDRAAALLRLADLMDRDAETLAMLDCEDAGKPITECRENDVPGAVETIRWFAEALDKTYGRVSTTSRDVLAFTEREPYGVVAAILPWNYPLAMAAWKIGPALAAGNCLLVKPADATPRSVQHVAALAREAGIRAGDAVVVFSSSGINPYPVEIAEHALEAGARVIAVTSRPASAAAPLRAGVRLADLADVVLDTLVPPGDVTWPAAHPVSAPLSSVTNALCWNLVLVAALDAAPDLPTWRSANTTAPADHNERLQAHYRRLVPAI